MAILAVGATATALILADVTGPLAPAEPIFAAALATAVGLTIASLMLRSLRWIFLLRRADVRIPIRDAYIGYMAGLSLLLTPLLLGEIAVRALVLRKRGGVTIATTIAVNLWERLLDFVALAFLAGALGIARGSYRFWTLVLLAGAIVTLAPAVRRLLLAAVSRVALSLGRFGPIPPATAWAHLTKGTTWSVAVVTSIAAWLLPAVAFWIVARSSGVQWPVLPAAEAYASAAVLGSVTLAPAGVLVVGPSLLDALAAGGFPAGAAALVVLGTRVATVGTAIVLGIVFTAIHARSTAAQGADHFDAIADAYDVQIPESRRRALLDIKTTRMIDALARHGLGRKGLDVGCGQGAYVARMRERGFDVAGIDESAQQVRLAARNVGSDLIVTRGSVLKIPAPDASYDFVYVINVLHHLSSVEEQHRALAEIFRVTRPGGLLFVHEINTRNILFRFYMGYVFPSLNCIDEGVERWLLPHRLDRYTDRPVVEVQYFTFLPDFVPQRLVRLLRPIERLLEMSPLRVYSAHYMAVVKHVPA
jgi:ubiquinone/menaquinone biosynthesis C-methylase UbiE/uncharacterized membrane protein YbhN (UPF0104 family)